MRALPKPDGWKNRYLLMGSQHVGSRHDNSLTREIIAPAESRPSPMTYPHPNQPAPGYAQPYPPTSHQPGRDQTPVPLPDESLSSWTAALLTLGGIVAHTDRVQRSSRQAMAVVTLIGLASLAVFAALLIYTYISHR